MLDVGLFGRPHDLGNISAEIRTNMVLTGVRSLRDVGPDLLAAPAARAGPAPS